jgi:anti-sigma factor RsiW
MSDVWTDRLSEYLDGDLPAEERRAIESHLQACPACAAALADLRRIIGKAQTLGEALPEGDLWPGIAAQIGAEGGVAAGHPRPATARGLGRRWSLSLPQLAAAGIALASVSGAIAWLLHPASRAPAASTPVTGMPLTVASAAARPSAEQRYAAAVTDLEQVLAEGRSRLDPSTVRVIERNLATIDSAIVQAQRALTADSGSLYLNSHLAATRRRKLDLLRHAVTLVSAAS